MPASYDDLAREAFNGGDGKHAYSILDAEFTAAKKANDIERLRALLPTVTELGARVTGAARKNWDHLIYATNQNIARLEPRSAVVAAKRPTEATGDADASGWLRRNWKAIAIGIVVFLIGVGIGTSGSNTKTTTVAGPTVTVSETQTVNKTRTVNRTKVHTVVRTRTVKVRAAAPPSAPPASGASDKDFRVEAVQIRDDGLGDIGGIARVTNTSGQSYTATFTFTFFQGSQIVGTAEAVADSVGGGQTVTVDLSSQDRMISGSFHYQFQVDTEF